MTVIGS